MPEHKYDYPAKFLTRDGKLNKKMMKQIREWRAKHGRLHTESCTWNESTQKRRTQETSCTQKLLQYKARKVRSGEAKCRMEKLEEYI